MTARSYGPETAFVLSARGGGTPGHEGGNFDRDDARHNR